MVASAALTESATAVDVQPTDITVNLDQSTGPVEYGVTGFLYGLADDGVPADTMLQGLGHLHTQVGRPTDANSTRTVTPSRPLTNGSVMVVSTFRSISRMHTN